MSLKARRQKNGETVIKQQSWQQATVNIGRTDHRTHPATIQRSQQYPHTMTPQDVLHLQSAIGNRGVGLLLKSSNQNADIARSGLVVQRTESVRAFTSPDKQEDYNLHKCWSAASLRIIARGKIKLFGGLKFGKMARKSSIAVYTWDKRSAYSVEFFPRAYFSPAVLKVYPNARVKLVSLNVPKHITHRINAGVIVNGVPVRRFKICGLAMV